jgi:hypothetical protein
MERQEGSMRTRLGFTALVVTLAVGVAVAAGASARSAATSTFTVKLKGTNEVPAAPASNAGSAKVTINAASGKVCWTFTISKIDGKPAQAHIHQGKKGVSGPIKIFFGTPNYKQKGCTTAAKSLTKAIVAHPSNFYVNVHNVKHPAGAMRGQL